MRNLDCIKSHAKRCCSAILGVAIAAGLFIPPAPFSTKASAAVSYAQPYMDKLSQWAVLQGDENGELRPNDPITRAEFIAMINRAYGYKEKADVKFSDVPEDAWYADDIAIATAAGYFSGTSASTAEPTAPLTREQAMVLLAKSGRLETIPGEVTEFTDGRDFSNWSKGYVKAAVNRNLVSGYPDNTFRPKAPITRGEMSVLLSNALGTLINTGGERELGDVYGNVTINAPGTTLKDTTIAGDLYISGGLEKGAVSLENVNVLGRIVIAGGGESEGSDDSVIFSNVETRELIVDNLANNYLSLRAEGDTTIDDTYVRSSAFIRDRTQDGAGLKTITFDSKNPGLSFTLAGDLQTIINKAPYSTLTVGEGTVQTLTIDELAEGSSLNIDYNATVKTVNLDTGVPITGNGDIETAKISTNGTSTSMLPDNVVLRPGITATVAGTNMNNTTAQESSGDPKLLAGFPDVGDVAPTSVKAAFSTNKPGTVYWAVSAIADGSIGETDLINPPSYSTKAIKSGKLTAAASKTTYTATISGLKKGGSYYLSAVMVDSRDTHSPVKVVSFTTPDDTVPNFASGYPYMSKVTNTSGQVSVMATKDCSVYYALYDKGSTAPTADDFKNGRINDSLGHGIVPLRKNLPDLFQVNDRDLDELKDYDLYLWLNDADNSKSSAIKKLTFSTVDKTPPEFVTDFTINKIENNSIGAVTTLNEDGTLYWVVVLEGTVYPTPLAGSAVSPALDSDAAKLQVSSGMGALKSGSVAMRENKEATVNMSGLQPATAYDIYYIAKDKAGNYSKEVKKVTSHTRDNIAPTVTQEFSSYAGDDDTKPYANTDVDIIFSENVEYINTVNKTSKQLLEYYETYLEKAEAGDQLETDTALANYADALRNTIKLFSATGGGKPVQVTERTPDNEDANDWVIDYRKATVEYTSDRQLVVHFPTKTQDNYKDSALNLSSGGTYYFQISNIQDISANRMGTKTLPRFTTISSQIAIDDLDLFGRQIKINETTEIDSDVGFCLTPISTSTADVNTGWDLLILADQSIEFELYRNAADKRDPNKNNDPLTNTWVQVGGSQSITIPSNEADLFHGSSYTKHFKQQSTFNSMRELDDTGPVYDFAIRITRIGNNTTRTQWTDTVNFKVYAITGTTSALSKLALENPTDKSVEDAIKTNKVTNVGITEQGIYGEFYAPFSDSEAPYFTDGRPVFEVYDTSVKMNLSMNRSGVIYYMVIPVDSGVPGLTTVYHNPDTSKEDEFNGHEVRGMEPTPDPLNKNDYISVLEIPESGDAASKRLPFYLERPNYLDIVTPKTTNSRYKHGSVEYTQGVEPVVVTDLEPDHHYLVYFVLRGASAYSENVQVYRFKTNELSRPLLYLQATDPNLTMRSNMDTDVTYIIVPNISGQMASLEDPFKGYMSSNYFDENGNLIDPNLEKYTEKTYRVIDAMANYIYDGNNVKCSVFDEYADPAKANDLANTIRSASGSGGGYAHSVYTNPNVKLNANNVMTVPYKTFQNMSPLTKYYAVAVGQATVQEMASGNAFGAAYPIELLDNEAPVITNVIPCSVNPQTGALSGSFSLIFSEPLYRPISNSDKRLPVTLASKSSDNYVSIHALTTGLGFADITGPDIPDTEALSRIDFTIKPDTNNTTINISVQGPLGDNYGNNQTGSSLEVRISAKLLSKTEIELDPTRKYSEIPEITVTRSWDAREK